MERVVIFLRIAPLIRRTIGRSNVIARPIMEGDDHRPSRLHLYIVVTCGLAVLTYAAVLHGKSQNPVKFFCYLVIAIAHLST